MFRCLLNYSFNLIIWIYSCFPTMGKTTKRDAGTNKYDAVPKRPSCVPTIEKKTANRVVLSGHPCPKGISFKTIVQKGFSQQESELFNTV
ncbi:hypothetical protein MAR_013936 [Mya arenaria]|uniref:Secreted protein n=1 Tax=Mya arenaria TaxID=6604 RepID=A0ABY7G2U1_MYAAR|nr:hypothetical protein MAR_013936 [Mya arenaria]